MLAAARDVDVGRLAPDRHDEDVRFDEQAACEAQRCRADIRAFWATPAAGVDR